MKEYDPPLTIENLPAHLLTDPVHKWRAETGIELIHREPTLSELNRIWDNWKCMSACLQQISDEKSVEFFGCNNETNYKKLITFYL